MGSSSLDSGWVQFGGAGKPEQQQWRGPCMGQLQMSTDGAWVAQTGKGGAGAVVRDWQGKLVAAVAIKIPHCGSAAAAALGVIREGLTLVKEKGWFNITIEGDAKAEIAALTKRKAGGKDNEVIVHDVLLTADKMQDLWVLFHFYEFDGFQKEAIQMGKPAKVTTTHPCFHLQGKCHGCCRFRSYI